MGDMSDCCPLVGAASWGKLRLVRLLVEGGADVNGSSLRGETPLLAACKSLQRDGVDAGSDIGKVINYLLQNKADPNAQDQSGRTALMLACAQGATAVVSGLLRAGADPTVQDQSGASALVYAARAQHPPTLKLILDTSRDMSRDIIVIATHVITNGTNLNEVTGDHLSIPPSPDPALLCTSPSDIVLNTRDVFTFRGDGSRGTPSPSTPRQRQLSELSLALPNQTHLHRDHKRGIRRRDHPAMEEHHPGISRSILTLSVPPDAPEVERFPPCLAPGSWARRNTLPSLTVVPSMLRFPPWNGKDRSQKLASKVSMLFVPHPPSSAPPPSRKESIRAAILKPRVFR